MATSTSAFQKPVPDYRRISIGAAAVLTLALATRGVRAQSPPPSEANRTVNVNYVYAAQLGFGGYSLAGLTADVFALPLGYTVPLGAGTGWSLRLTLPVQLGLYSFRATDTDGTPIKISQQSLAAVPGVELQMPVARNVVLKPFADVGFAHAFGATSGADALIYAVGARSVAQWHAGAYTLSLGNALLYAGDEASNFRESYVSLQAGFEIRRSLGFVIHGIEPDLGAFVSEYYYPKPLRFSRFLRDPLKISEQTEIGVTVGSAKPFDTVLLGNARIGVGYVFGGGLQVWHVAFGFPF